MTSSYTSQECLVFDVGGTNLRCAVYDAHTRSLSRQKSRTTPSLVTLPDAKPEEIRDALIGAIVALGNEVAAGRPPATVSMAFAGPIDPQGHVLAAPTIWGRSLNRPVDLAARLKRFWPTARVLVANDVTAAGYCYLRGSQDDLSIVTVSSGIGNKVFVRGTPIVGPNGRGGEIGHVRVDFSPDAPLCDCGHRGHLGAVSSGRGTLHMAKRLAEREPAAFRKSLLYADVGTDANALTNRAIVGAFRRGDEWTTSLVGRAARPLAQMLAGIHLSVGVERFVIFGGFALALGEAYRRMLVDLAGQCTWNMGQDWNRMLELGLRGGDSGLIGAGRFATEFNGGERHEDGDEGEAIQLSVPIRQRRGRFAA